MPSHVQNIDLTGLRWRGKCQGVGMPYPPLPSLTAPSLNIPEPSMAAKYPRESFPPHPQPRPKVFKGEGPSKVLQALRSMHLCSHLSPLVLGLGSGRRAHGPVLVSRLALPMARPKPQSNATDAQKDPPNSFPDFFRLGTQSSRKLGEKLGVLKNTRFRD